MGLRPWSKFYWADWRADPRLRMCSRAARSLWLDMCGLMHEAQPYGHLLVAGIAPDCKQLAAILGDPPKDVAKWVIELEAAQVFSRTATGTIYSRRMVRDREREDRDKANGRGGGNPSLKPADNEGVNPPDKAQSPEATFHSAPSGAVEPEVPDGRRAGRKKPQREIPADWQPAAAGFELARSNGFGPAETERIVQRFRDHWISKAERRADWDATWRTWIGNEVEYRRVRGGTPSAKPDLAEQQQRDRAGILAALAPELPVRGQPS